MVYKFRREYDINCIKLVKTGSLNEFSKPKCMKNSLAKMGYIRLETTREILRPLRSLVLISYLK